MPSSVVADPAGPRRVAVVSGASRGIGAHLADALEAGGYAVERGSRRVAEVTDAAAVRRWAADVDARHGRVDVLVNNAGVIDEEVGFFESDPDQWWDTIRVNVRGPYLLTHAFGPALRRCGGRVLNLSSGAATRGSDEASAYNTSKTALTRITGAVAAGTAHHGVRAFDLAPGVVRTDMTASMRAHRDRTEWTDPAEVAALALAVAGGELDAWSGRMVRAGMDTPASLTARARAGLGERERTVALAPWGPDDPLVPSR